MDAKNDDARGALRGARWIGDAQRPVDGGRPCPFLRRDFTLRGPARRAVLVWTALGLAELRINGRPVDDTVLSPGWSDYRKRTQVMSVDVGALLVEGENRIEAILADGWYCGFLLWNGERNHYGQRPALLARLEVETAEGGRVVVASDARWELGEGPIRSADLYHGESHDARVSPGKWRPADLLPAYRGALQPKVNEPMRVVETLKPVALREARPGVHIADFGQNLVGWCRLRIRARRGSVVTLRFAEMLEADGSLYTANLRAARATDTYVCRGGGEPEEWAPRFTFHGFRYAEISGLESEPGPDDLLACVVHSDLRPTGDFTCSNPLVNRLHLNIRWGQRGNFLDVPTDCPQRDERLGWTGDAQVFVGTAAFHYDVRSFFRKWLQDLRDGQRADGAFPDVAPDLLPGSGNAAWADAGVIVPWRIYLHYGDVETLRENYGAMERWIDCQLKGSRGLLRPRTAYGDWLAIDAVTPQNAPVPSDLVGTAYFAHTTGLMAKISRVLGREADAKRFRALAGRIAQAFRQAYVTPGGRIVGHCQTAYLLALAFDLLPVRQRQAAFAHLVDLIEQRDFHLTTGFVGTPLLCPVLTRFGRSDLAYKLLLQDSYPSWLFTVKNGATTMWERWNSYTPEAGFGPVGMNSFNHYAYGAVGEWIYAVVGGIRPQAPGYRRVLFAPEPGGGILHASTGLETAFGRVACEWRLSGRKLTARLTVPAGVRARFRAPAGFEVAGASEIALSAGAQVIQAVRTSRAAGDA